MTVMLSEPDSYIFTQIGNKTGPLTIESPVIVLGKWFRVYEKELKTKRLTSQEADITLLILCKVFSGNPELQSSYAHPSI
jgi:hypothetical protein